MMPRYNMDMTEISHGHDKICILYMKSEVLDMTRCGALFKVSLIFDTLFSINRMPFNSLLLYLKAYLKALCPII